MLLPDIWRPSMIIDTFHPLFLWFSSQFTRSRRLSRGCCVSRAVCCFSTVRNARGLTNPEILTMDEEIDSIESRVWYLDSNPFTKDKASLGPHFHSSIQCLGVCKCTNSYFCLKSTVLIIYLFFHIFIYYVIDILSTTSFQYLPSTVTVA